MRAFLPRALHSHRLLDAALLGLLFGLGSAAVSLLPADLDAKNRDSDASRMQARKIAFPSSLSDSLAPPADRVDWAYFKLSNAARVSIGVEFAKASIGGRLSLASATGRELASSTEADGKARVRKSLAPGIYYVSVESSKAASYKLSVE